MAANNNDVSYSGDVHPSIAFITALFGASTTLPVFFQSLASDKGDPDEARLVPQLITRSTEAVIRFLRHDRARRGLFFCVSTLADDVRVRSKETVRETVGLHLDIDFKSVVEDEPGIHARLATLRCPPTVVVRSGGGLHLYWLFKEGLDTQAYLERLEAALRALAAILGGDPAVCQVAALMRLPGTHNSKYGDLREVVCERLDGPRYELDELEEWIAETTIVLTRKPEVRAKDAKPTAAFAETDEDLWDAIGRKLGHRTPVDVDELLEAMAFGNIHKTQLRVSAALVHRGCQLEEVVELLMAETRKVAGEAKWNWRIEERTIRGMCATALEKFPPLGGVSHESLPASGSVLESGAGPAHNSPPNSADDETAPPADDTVIDFAKAKTKTKRKRAATSVHIVLAEAVLAVMRQRGEELMFTEVGDYRYFDALWRCFETEKALCGWLNSAIEEAAQGLKMESSNRLINEARGYILRAPALQKRGVPFDAHRQIPTRSGLIDPCSGKITAPMPEHYCTWRIEHAYVPTAVCPWWLTMLEDVFSDRSAESRALHVQLLQEVLGAGLIDEKDKVLSRAVIFVGGSDYGKSGLIDVLAGLFGRKRNVTPLDALEKDHGTMPFVDRVPWVLHEAFDAGKWHVSSIVKAIISGDGIRINIKNGKMFDKEVTVPIFWGTNVPPQFKEATKAIVNRVVVIECRRLFDQDNPVGAALEARKRGFRKPSTFVLATEAEGILAWAVEGLKRLLARGHFIVPKESRTAAENVRLDSNIVAEFLADCVKFDPNWMISTADFAAAHASWWFEHKGDGREAPASERIGTALRAFGDPRIAADRKELRSDARRYYAGIKLNAEGKRHWRNTVTSNAFIFQGRKASTTDAGEEPNRMIPDAWDGKPVIQAMYEAHDKMGVPPEDDEGERSSLMDDRS